MVAAAKTAAAAATALQEQLLIWQPGLRLCSAKVNRICLCQGSGCEMCRAAGEVMDELTGWSTGVPREEASGVVVVPLAATHSCHELVVRKETSCSIACKLGSGRIVASTSETSTSTSTSETKLSPTSARQFQRRTKRCERKQQSLNCNIDVRYRCHPTTASS